MSTKKDITELKNLKFVNSATHSAIRIRLNTIADIEERLSDLYEKLANKVPYNLRAIFMQLSEDAGSRAAEAEMLSNEIS